MNKAVAGLARLAGSKLGGYLDDALRIGGQVGQDLATAGNSLSILQYNEYVDKFIDQEDEIVTTTLAEEVDASETSREIAELPRGER